MKIRRDPLDALVSRFVRMRDKGTCQRCGHYLGLTQGLHCAHFHKRRKQSVRYDEDNCVALCLGCHQYFDENHNEFEQFMKQRLGEKGFDFLSGRMRRVGRPDKNALILYYTEKIKEFEKCSIKV